MFQSRLAGAAAAWRTLPFVAAAFLAGSCTVPPPSPIDPERTEAAFRARTLSGPGLEDYIEAHVGRQYESFPPPTWSLEALTLAALFFSDELDAVRARVEGAEAAEVTAGARPNPTLGAGLQYNPDVPHGNSPWTYAFDLSIPIQIGGKRHYRMERARHLGEAARIELAEAAWRTRSRVRNRLADRLLSLRQVRIIEQEAAALADLGATLERRLAAGAIARPPVDAARLERSTTDLELAEAKGRAEVALAELAAALGVPADAVRSIAVHYPGLESGPPQAPSAGDLQEAGLLNRLDLRRLLVQYAAAESALRLEVARTIPDLNLGPGYQWEEGERKFFLGLSSVLPILNRNEGPIAEAVARRKETGARFLALQARIIGDIEAASSAYRASREMLGEADRVVANAEAVERSVRLSVEVGEADPADLPRARVRTAEARLARLQVLWKAFAAFAALEDALQRPLDAAAPFHEVELTSPRTGAKPEEDGAQEDGKETP